jgi:hypothetical protein
MRNIILISVGLLYTALCSADKVGVDLPVSALMLSVPLTILGLVFAPKIFSVEKNAMMPYVLAWFYSVFLLAAAIGAYGEPIELGKALYVASLVVFFLGLVVCFILYKRKSVLTQREFNNIFILYFIGFSFANFYAGFF